MSIFPPGTLNRRQVRLVDQWAVERYGMSGLVLMENAARGAVDVLRRLGLAPSGAAGPVVVCCGRGNNGGDGLAMARHLDNLGVPVRIVLFGDPRTLSPDAAANFRTAEKADLPIKVFPADVDEARLSATLTGASCVIDALLGTGAAGDPRPPLDRVIAAINGQRAPVVAVDLPSGLDCDTGAAAASTIRAAHTITFVAPKPGFFRPEAAPYVGRVHTVDIGVPRKLLREVAAA